jgi:hypothetical protein
MKRLWISLAAGLSLAVAVWHVRGDRAEAPAVSPAATSGNETPRTAAPPRRDVVTPHVVGAAQLDDAERAAIADLTAAEADDALGAVIGAAESYWELSADARAAYDRLEAQRLARLGVGDVTHRLAPHREALTLDGKHVTP